MEDVPCQTKPLRHPNPLGGDEELGASRKADVPAHRHLDVVPEVRKGVVARIFGGDDKNVHGVGGARPGDMRGRTLQHSSQYISLGI